MNGGVLEIKLPSTGNCSMLNNVATVWTYVNIWYCLRKCLCDLEWEARTNCWSISYYVKYGIYVNNFKFVTRVFKISKWSLFRNINLNKLNFFLIWSTSDISLTFLSFLCLWMKNKSKHRTFYHGKWYVSLAIFPWRLFYGYILVEEFRKWASKALLIDQIN